MTARLTDILTGIMTGIMTGITTGVAAGVKLVFTTVELDCYAFFSWCIHTPSSDIQQGWYAGIKYTPPLGIAGSLQQNCL